MSSKINLAFVGALTMLSLAAFAAKADAATSVPNADIESICRDARSGALPEDSSLAFSACVHDERTALETLRRRWTSYSAEARGTCTAVADEITPSYVELLTCLEIQPGGRFGVESSGPDGLDPAADLASPAPSRDRSTNFQ
jgi:hypothetical protein